MERPLLALIAWETRIPIVSRFVSSVVLGHLSPHNPLT